MPPSIPTHCPHCGTSVPASSIDTLTDTCIYCSGPVHGVKLLPARVIEPPPTALPLEFNRLKRPRPSRPASSFGYLGVGFGILWFVLSLIFTGFGIYAAYQDQRTYDLLMSEGQAVQGTVVQLQVDDNGDSNDYIVYYNYVAIRNNWPVTLHDRQTVAEAWYYTLQVGQAVDVVYARSQPQTSQLKRALAAPNPLLPSLFTGLGLLFIGIGTAILMTAIVNMRDDWRMRRNGQEIWATVFDRWQDNDSDGKTIYAIAYAFRIPLPDGTLKLITHAELNRNVYLKAQIGSRVRVCYVQANPEINRLV